VGHCPPWDHFRTPVRKRQGGSVRIQGYVVGEVQRTGARLSQMFATHSWPPPPRNRITRARARGRVTHKLSQRSPSFAPWIPPARSQPEERCSSTCTPPAPISKLPFSSGTRLGGGSQSQRRAATKSRRSELPPAAQSERAWHGWVLMRCRSCSQTSACSTFPGRSVHWPPADAPPAGLSSAVPAIVEFNVERVGVDPEPSSLDSQSAIADRRRRSARSPYYVSAETKRRLRLRALRGEWCGALTDLVPAVARA
jgi:hypothetical protein